MTWTAACDESPTAPSAADVAGRWVVSSLQPATAAAITPPVPLVVQFDGNRVSVQGDCNTCGGGFTLTSGVLAMSALACTRRGCPAGSLDDPFFDLLGNARTAELGDTVLTLEGERGRVVLQR